MKPFLVEAILFNFPIYLSLSLIYKWRERPAQHISLYYDKMDSKEEQSVIEADLRTSKYFLVH